MSKRNLRYGFLAVGVAGLASLVWVARPAAQGFGGPAPEAVAKAEAAATPRMKDGHPNLTGFWAGGGQGEDGTPDAPQDAGDSNAFTRSGIHEITKTPDGSIFFSYAGANGGTEAA